MSISVRRFLKVYGIQYRTEKTGFMTYTAHVRTPRGQLTVPGLKSFFAPTFADALRPIVAEASGFVAFDASFDLFAARRHGSSRAESRARWQAMEQAFRKLWGVFSDDALNDLILRVRLK